MALIQNITTLLSTPGMIPAWITWNLRVVGLAPKVRQPLGGELQGFRSFSEYWGAIHLVPPAHEVAYIHQKAGTSGVMIDAGANLGCMSLTMTKARPALKVHCFEPSPETFSLLKNNLQFNRAANVHPHQKAVGAAPGKLKFLNDPDSAATNKLVTGDTIGNDCIIEVDVITIDGFMSGLGDLEVAFLKIDVEGYEAEVIRGAENLFKSQRCKCALVELCPGNLTAAGSSVEIVLKAVHDAGQELYYLNQDGSPGMTVTVENAASIVLTNVAMLPPGQ